MIELIMKIRQVFTSDAARSGSKPDPDTLDPAGSGSDPDPVHP